MPTVEQYVAISCPVGATNQAVSVTLAASDLLIVLSSQGSGGGRTVAVSGFGTWTRYGSYAGSFNAYVDTLTGVTGTGDVTITVGGSAATAALIVVRGLVTPSITALGWSAGSQLGGTVPIGTPLSFGPNQVAVAHVFDTSTTSPITFPDAGSLPSIGAWTVGVATASGIGGYSAIGGYVLGSDGVTPHQPTFTRGISSHAWSGFLLVLGEPVANALVEQTQYVEAVVTGTPALVLQTEYTEAVIAGTPALLLATEYVEVVTTWSAPAVAGNRRGWGVIAH